MTGPIYKCWRGRFTEAWYRLAKAEQDDLLVKVQAVLDQVGGKTLIACMSDWANEGWMGFGVEEFPDIDAVQKHAALLNELNWHRYIASEHLLGTRFEE